jgi:hypothetical protein
MKQTKFLSFICAILLCATACQKNNSNPATPPAQIPVVNSGFESKLDSWKIESDYKGVYGFTADTGARRSGLLGLNFYAAQSTHWVGAPQETPWNGTIYQIVSGLKDGSYTFKAYADAVGDGMFLWAQGDPEQPGVKVKIKSDQNELNSVDFVVKGGIAKIGFICVNAGGTATYAPYFHADDIELWTK